LSELPQAGCELPLLTRSRRRYGLLEAEKRRAQRHSTKVGRCTPETVSLCGRRCKVAVGDGSAYNTRAPLQFADEKVEQLIEPHAPEDGLKLDHRQEIQRVFAVALRA
jgi:hypothetical protein